MRINVTHNKYILEWKFYFYQELYTVLCLESLIMGQNVLDQKNYRGGGSFHPPRLNRTGILMILRVHKHKFMASPKINLSKMSTWTEKWSKTNMLTMDRDRWKGLTRRLQICICFYGTTISYRVTRSSLNVTSSWQLLTTDKVKNKMIVS